MKKKDILPNNIPIFPLDNFIFFPETNVPLNIFEPRYIKMIDDAMRGSKMIGMIQPRKTSNDSKRDLYNVGCLGKITSYNESQDGRYLVVLKGLTRFKIIKEIKNNKLYRECEIDYKGYENDINIKKEDIKFSDLEVFFIDLKKLFKKRGYVINWKEIEKQSLDQTINTLAMASPFSLEEKQVLLETPDLKSRKNKLGEIIKTYVLDDFSNTTIQ
ncbi:LON peptidase substrate-binding domain-containing protein [Candidatus Pelagibacter sp.]|nr:LON peptidase substrate-binding domain-containing protein [Candidatus Pelagibacter sp.]